MFYHLNPVQGADTKAVKAKGPAEARDAIGSDGYLSLQVPVLNKTHVDLVEPATAAVILMGFGWVLWKIFVVWRTVGYGRVRVKDGDGKEGKKKQ